MSRSLIHQIVDNDGLDVDSSCRRSCFNLCAVAIGMVPYVVYYQFLQTLIAIREGRACGQRPLNYSTAHILLVWSSKSLLKRAKELSAHSLLYLESDNRSKVNNAKVQYRKGSS